MRTIISNQKATMLLVLLLGFFIWSFTPKNASETPFANKKIYCQLYVNNTYNRIQQKWSYEIDVNYGEYLKYDFKSLEQYKVQSFTNYLDALNYLGSRGWKLVLTNRHMVDGYNHYQDYYLLEKDTN
ncbi:MAG: hypothetical protein R2816_12395 [Flavobacteriaceae bacterium]|nr:hypothetical protein [Flavobacteriaceae bacterium]